MSFLTESVSKCAHEMTIGIDAIEGLARSLPDAIENETMTPEQLGYLLLCINYSLLAVQRDLVKLIDDESSSVNKV